MSYIKKLAEDILRFRNENERLKSKLEKDNRKLAKKDLSVLKTVPRGKKK